MLWVSQSELSQSGACSGLLHITLAASVGAWSGVVAGWLQVSLAARFWGLEWEWGTMFPLAYTHCQILESDPRMLGSSRLMRRPGARALSGSMCSCKCLGACWEVLHHSLQRHGGGSRQVMAGKQHSLSILYPSFLKIVSSAVSNFF